MLQVEMAASQLTSLQVVASTVAACTRETTELEFAALVRRAASMKPFVNHDELFVVVVHVENCVRASDYMKDRVCQQFLTTPKTGSRILTFDFRLDAVRNCRISQMT